MIRKPKRKFGRMVSGCYTWFAFELPASAGNEAPLTRLMRQTYARAFLAIPERGVLHVPRPDSSVVERGPEKAGVGGSIPSLATILLS